MKTNKVFEHIIEFNHANNVTHFTLYKILILKDFVKF